MITAALVLLAISAQALAADQPVWGQCGGIGWTGSTTCVAGSTCTKQNDYYSQCLPSSTTVAPTTTTTTTTAPPTTTTTPPAGTSKYWFSFGDSYTQTGFVTNGTLPSATNPLGNPTYPGYTACGSYDNWIDLVSTKYKSGTVLTYNFAYGGATIDANLVTPYTPTVLSMTDQVNQFLTSFASKPASTPWQSANSIFSFFIGINDIGNSYYNSGDRDAFSDTLLNAYFALVQKVYAQGGRNFLFINVPGVDRSPLMLSQAATAQAAEKLVIDHFNTKLAAKVASFQAANAGTKTWVYNSHDKLVSILNAPASFGFQDATSYGSATNLVWCNNYHIGPKVHDYYAQDVAALLKGTFY